MPQDKIILIVFSVLLVVIIIASVLLILFFLHQRNWPLLFNLKNVDNPQAVEIYANGYTATTRSIKKGEVSGFTIGSNVKNQTTSQPLRRDQLKSLVIRLLSKGEVDFEPVNFSGSIVLSRDLAGFSPIKMTSDERSGKLNSVGYYTIDFPNGVNYF